MYALFHCTDENGCLNKYALAQYWFDGPPVEVKPKPHGNAQSSRPYFRVADSAKARHRAIASKVGITDCNTTAKW